MARLSGQDPVDGVDGAPGDERGGLVHAVEGRHVRSAHAHGRWLPGMVAERAHLLDVVQRVEPREVRVAGCFRGDQAPRAEGAEQVDARPEAQWRQGVARPEVVLTERLAPDEDGLLERISQRMAPRRLPPAPP